MSQRNMSELSWREARAAGGAGIALLPIGSQEQHAAHLPLGTDTLLVEAVVDRALALLAAPAPGEHATEVVRLPTLPYGHSPHHLFAAALSLSAPTLAAVLDDLLSSLVASGFSRVLVVNGHGGNDEIMRLAAKRFVLRPEAAGATVAACSYWTVTADDAAADGTAERPEVTPGHAGWFETSLMLAAHPGLVRTPVPAREPVVPPPLFDNPPHPGLTTERHGEWARVGGSTDDASGAAADAGRRLLDARARGLARAVRAFDSATRPQADPGTAPTAGTSGTPADRGEE
ncbi:creatininase family protein [Streptomyces sp. NPDC047002]|uniref:creatininase family protein n=1 Tax=Streptomyces sp. NPDC047002 TaxID=3155475 RepID=UPI00345352C3